VWSAVGRLVCAALELVRPGLGLGLGMQAVGLSDLGMGMPALVWRHDLGLR